MHTHTRTHIHTLISVHGDEPQDLLETKHLFLPLRQQDEAEEPQAQALMHEIADLAGKIGELNQAQAELRAQASHKEEATKAVDDELVCVSSLFPRHDH